MSETILYFLFLIRPFLLICQHVRNQDAKMIHTLSVIVTFPKKLLLNQWGNATYRVLELGSYARLFFFFHLINAYETFI
jgi:hypothetical protein